MSEERDQHIEQLVHRFEKALERLERATATLEPPVPQAERAPQRQQPVTEQGKPVETSPGGGATDKSQPKPHDKQSVAASASRSASRADKPALRRPGKAVKAPVDAWRILRYVGVALLLLGTAFLFNYVQEESRGLMWLRVGTAFAIGLGLITVGLRLRTREPQFSQVLSGGGTGVWFITGFAAYQVFGLIPAPVGLAWMAIVTLICFLFSIRHDAESLALIGTIGGLSTPFLFEASARGPIGVVVFVLYVVGCALAIHVHRGWRPLLWAAVLGSWGALTVCLWQYVLEATTTASVTEKVALQLGVTCLWLAFAVVPVAREAASRANPGRWPRPVWLRDSSDLLVLANLAPLVALFMTGAVWDLDKQPGGLVALGGALAYTIVVLRTRNVPGFPGFRTAHIQAAVMLWTVALCMLLEGDTLRFALATEAAFLLRMRRHSPRLLLAIWGHGLFLVLGWVVLLGLTSALTGKGGMVVGDLPLLNARGAGGFVHGRRRRGRFDVVNRSPAATRLPLPCPCFVSFGDRT